MKLPKARNENLVVQTLQSEVLIYNLITHKAICLNETSAKVFNACDGNTSIDELKLQYKFTDDLIYLALDELKENNLLEENYNSPFTGLSRREVIRRVGMASMIALPVITGLIAPTSAAAQSTTCQSGQGPGDTNGFIGNGDPCQCSNSGQFGFRPCNTSRGGDGFITAFGCRAGCLCYSSVVGNGLLAGQCG